MRQCKYSFSHKKWSERDINTNHKDVSEINGWECPHVCVEGEDYCIFHLPPNKKSDEEVVDALIEYFSSENTNKLIGARFDNLDLRHKKINQNSSKPIKLNFVEVKGRLDISGEKLDRPLWLRNSIFEKIRFDDMEFGEECEIINCIFKTNFSAVNTVFHNRLVLLDNIFQNYSSFENSRFRGRFDCSNTIFEKEIDMSDIKTYEGFNFQNNKLGDDLKLHDAKLLMHIDLELTNISDDYIIIDCNNSVLKNGSISINDNEDILYDLHNATLGSINFSNTGDGSVFEMINIRNTNFDDFDFANHKEEILRIGYNIHSLSNLSRLFERPFSRQSVAELETTYLKARKGAANSDATDIQSEFFSRQMRFRRKSHFDRILSDHQSLRGKLFSFNQWLVGTLLGVTCGYGERPTRVVLASVSTIGIYTIVYNLLSVPVPYSGSSSLDPILFSLQAFVALLVGAPSTVNRGMTLIVVSQAFVGALLISLFIVTLTRSFDTDR